MISRYAQQKNIGKINDTGVDSGAFFECVTDGFIGSRMISIILNTSPQFLEGE
ncbi:hypothetical protein NCCP133_39320 [Cytobacillus sp. NCCP-133]|nr:hypothetical protein NCCP133_39320 [Cytobacillus sp. NCCP-133]